MSSAPPPPCSSPGCPQPAAFHCGACRTAHYCSKACQAAHWRGGHKGECCAPTAPLGEGTLPLEDRADLYALLCLFHDQVRSLGYDAATPNVPPLHAVRNLLAHGFTNYYCSSDPEGTGLLSALEEAVGHAGFPDGVRACWEGVPQVPGDDRPALASCDAAASAARIARDVLSGDAQVWGLHGVGRLYGVFYVVGYTPEGTLLVEVVEQKEGGGSSGSSGSGGGGGGAGPAPPQPPRVFLVRGVTNSLASALLPARRAAHAAGAAARAAPLALRLTLLAYRGHIVYAGAAEPVRSPLRAPAAAALLAAAAAAAAAPLRALPPPPPGLPSASARFAAVRATSPLTPGAQAALAAQPAASAAEAQLLAAFLSPSVRQPAAFAPGSAWTLRRLAHSEAENPNLLTSCASSDGRMGGLQPCAALQPTVLELLALLGSSVRELRARPSTLLCDAEGALPRLRALLQGSSVEVVLYYPPPSPEEEHVNEQDAGRG